ncbi:hypothetical protein PFISCL1PPCAC_21521, partial [Pristionchus fissidentatus]
QRICNRCTRNAHASHFHYTEIFTTSGQLWKELDRLKRARDLLVEERAAINNKKNQTNYRTTVASKEIAAKCTLIIAQAISRCLDVQSQMEVVRKRRCQEIETRVSIIDRTLEKIKKASAMAARSNSVNNLAVRCSLQKASFAMTQPLHAECEKMRVDVNREATSLNVSYSANFDSIMDSIATLGEHITLNSIYAGEAPQQ